MAYRMFVDEVGNADLRSSVDPNHRYLSLTGVILNMDTYAEGLDAEFKRIKQTHFGTESVILHRRDMLDGRGPFQVLKESVDARSAFDADLLKVLTDLNYAVITIAIDKQAHKDKYGRWQFHSYHYCMTCLVERYVKWLNRYASARGDVLAESRNRVEDEKLKDSYKRFHQRGSAFENKRERLNRLTSSELKLAKKAANVNGLQLADILASPSFRRMLCEREGTSMSANFGGKVAQILMSKYDRNGEKILGYGCKWLP